MTKRLGVLTIGQAPRADGLGRDVQRIAGPAIEVVERGALDGLSAEAIAEIGPRPGDYLLITMLADGSPVRLSRSLLLPHLLERIEQLETEDEVDLTLLVCNGEFPPLRHRAPLVRPQAALFGAVLGLASGGRIGALAPLPEQVEPAVRKWRELGVEGAVVVPAEPYGPDPIAACRRGAEAARAAGADLLFMDGFAYSLEMREAARAAFNGPVVLARSLAARLAAELLS